MTGLLETPYGTQDFLPAEAASKRIIEQKIFKLFATFGYQEVVTPAMEYLETLTISGGRVIEPHLFKMFDRNNRTLALRHEMTTPIARLAVSRLKDSPMPLKLSYLTNVFRFRTNQPGRQCEFYQAGVELLGVSNAFADAEIIALAAQALSVAGLEDFKICLGQVEFVNGLMENLPLNVQAEIKSAIEHHDIVALNNLDVDDTLKKIPTLQGGTEILTAAQSLAKNDRSRKALDNLTEIYRLLEIYGVADKITFDLGLIRDFEYYTGMVFEAYSHGVGYSLAGGGRYDHMLKDFGAACPATGFALGIERILDARKFQGVVDDSRAKDFYLSYAAGKESAAIQKAAELRTAGKVVEVSLTPQSKSDAEKSCAEKNCLEFVYVA
ncbi:MAG: ATP phosphoribosyltransferase regulatory subunit [Selenomonadaceae bacterium]|nr:ATP phosphoribosyltransferase regulatory subunit [Selenomonadaceae bacterium]MBQ7723222.1 ATP phosphoribosyltransferase regulatory subunit [Selenomonadaceae bacterium]